jgi:hypothetical protein
MSSNPQPVIADIRLKGIICVGDIAIGRFTTQAEKDDITKTSKIFLANIAVFEGAESLSSENENPNLRKCEFWTSRNLSTGPGKLSGCLGLQTLHFWLDRR